MQAKAISKALYYVWEGLGTLLYVKGQALGVECVFDQLHSFGKQNTLKCACV